MRWEDCWWVTMPKISKKYRYLTRFIQADAIWIIRQLRSIKWSVSTVKTNADAILLIGIINKKSKYLILLIFSCIFSMAKCRYMIRFGVTNVKPENWRIRQRCSPIKVYFSFFGVLRAPLYSNKINIRTRILNGIVFFIFRNCDIFWWDPLTRNHFSSGFWYMVTVSDELKFKLVNVEYDSPPGKFFDGF